MSVLREISRVSVRATKRFVASDHIQSANIGFMNEEFKYLFLNKVEKDVPAAELAISKLTKASIDTPLMAELGEKKRLSLAHFFQLLEKQAKGQSGALLTNGYSNIVYIQDEEGNFWAVVAGWNSIYCYWDVSANSVEFPVDWNAGNQVFSQVSSRS